MDEAVGRSGEGRWTDAELRAAWAARNAADQPGRHTPEDRDPEDRDPEDRDPSAWLTPAVATLLAPVAYALAVYSVVLSDAFGAVLHIGAWIGVVSLAVSWALPRRVGYAAGRRAAACLAVAPNALVVLVMALSSG